jgi:ABC-type transporter Mla subunit MlaD
MPRARRPLLFAAILVALAGMVTLLVQVLTLNEEPAPKAVVGHSRPAGNLTRGSPQHP